MNGSKTLLPVLVAALVVAVGAASPTLAQSTAKKPNILVIWGDDIGTWNISHNGKLPAVGNSVDLATATYTDKIGAAQLATAWTDPDFKADQSAFYYARVLEIPTPRWNTSDAARLNMTPLTKVPATIQERAWSSAIWYTPAK